MNIEDMQQVPIFEPDVCPEAAARFAPARRDVIVSGSVYGETRQQKVAVGSAFVTPVLPEFCVIAKLFGYVARLMLLAAIGLLLRLRWPSKKPAILPVPLYGPRPRRAMASCAANGGNPSTTPN